MLAADERQLICDVQAGSREAFRFLVERYMKQAYNVAYNFVSDHDDAEDIAQEAFIRVNQSIRSFRGDSTFSTWLYRIVVNLSLNKVRQKRSKFTGMMQPIDSNMIDIRQYPITTYQPDVQVHIEQALHQLPTLQRATVILRHLNGLSTKQVSSILRCSEGTVKTHLHRGLRKMRTMLFFMRDDR